MGLKAKTISGVKWTTASTVIVALTQLLQLSILTRFLSPSDFGLMAIVMVVIGFSQAFLDMGLSNAIIHKQTITDDQLSSLYWLNVFMGFFIFFVICAISPLVAFFYKEPQLTKLLAMVGLTFIIQPFGQQFMVLWQKEMRFAEMSKIDVMTKLLSLVVSVVFAYLGCRVYALVYGTLAAVIAQTLLFVSMGLREHRPRMIFRWREINEFINFGAYQMGERVMNYFSFQFDVIIIGKLLGTETLGIYNVAKQLIMRPAQIINPIITKVTFPAMAKVQNNVGTLRQVYLKTINYLSSVNFLTYAMLICLAPEIVLLLFGSTWMAATSIVRILSIYGAVRSTGNPVGSLLLARGKASLGFYWNLGSLFYSTVAITIGSHFGLTGISWMLVAVQASLVIPGWYFLIRPLCGATLNEYCLQMLQPLVFSLFAVTASYLVTYPLTGDLVRVVLISVISTAFFLWLSWRFNREWIKAIGGLIFNKSI